MAGAATHETVPVGQPRKLRRPRQVELPLTCQPVAEERSDTGTVTAEQVEDEPLEIGRLADVHRRAAGGSHFVAAAYPVDPGLEELVQDVVLVGGQHQCVDGQPHLARHVAGADVAEVTGGHGKADPLIIARGDPQPQRHVVDDLGRQPRPVDRVDRPDAMGRLELGIRVDGLDDVLAVVEDAIDGDVMDVLVGQAEHLGLLERGHPASGGQHVDGQTIAAPHRILGRRAGVSAGGAENCQLLVAPGEFVLEQFAEQLHRHVLERSGGAVRQVTDPQRPVTDPVNRDDAGFAELLGGVGTLADGQQIVGRDVVDEQAENAMGQRRVTLGGQHTAPLFKGSVGQLRILGRYVEPTVGRQTLEQDVAEARRWCAGHPSGRDVSHPSSLAGGPAEPRMIIPRRFMPTVRCAPRAADA